MFLPPTHTLFYTIEKAIKTYRKFAQKQLSEVASDITLDQALLLLLIADHPNLSQAEMSGFLFKEDASMTRMLALLITNGYLRKMGHPSDGRRSRITITQKGERTLDSIRRVVARNRSLALEGISEEAQTHLKTSLRQLTANCEEAMRDTLPDNSLY